VASAVAEPVHVPLHNIFCDAVIVTVCPLADAEKYTALTIMMAANIFFIERGIIFLRRSLTSEVAFILLVECCFIYYNRRQFF
jgi:hypothetical protein